jgi:hypothetical protein
MEHALEAAVRRFVAAHRDADVVEAVVDTSVDGPCLNLWAWRIQNGKHFDDAMREVADTGDGGFLADIVDELGSSTFEIGLAAVYPQWPDAIERGDDALVRLLEAAAAGLPARTRCLFHHVDAWPAVAIRTGAG